MPLTLIFTSGGGEQFRAGIKAGGQFALHLDPGLYTIAAAPPPFSGRLDPSSVRVPPNGSVFLHLRIAMAQ